MKRSPPSLQLRLSLAVCGVLALTLFGFSFLLQAAFARALTHQIDERLGEDARAIANLVEERARGPWEFETGAADDLERTFGAAYVEAKMDDGTVLARSPARAVRWPASALGTIATITLDDGRRARLYRVALPPRADDETPTQHSGRRVYVTVVRTTEDVDTTMRTLRLLLWGSVLTALSLACIAGLFAIRAGLKPIARLSARADALDANALGERLPIDALPRELRPAVSKLNQLLARVEQTFERERQWNRAVSHELRTPLAGLRTILDVALSRPREAEAYRHSIEQAHQVVIQMSELIEQLLLLARLDARAWQVSHDVIDLRELVDECFAAFADKARERELRFDNQVRADRVLSSDRDKLRLIVRNLIGNAVEYTARAGCVSVTSPAADGGVLDVCDSGPAIPTEALGRIFDPFVRLEPARSGGEHCGIGLTIVSALCDVLRLAVVAENRADGWVVFRVRAREPARS
ncbi:MAG TPA: ATP-binding protein [Polyangiales bacterium]|nr:ATP-binding protein [Polyangiales bacterium]